VFVSKGAMNGTGTKESPVGSIADGMVAAKGAGLTRIIVCNATYAENVTIQSSDGALSIYGGFKCPVASGDAGADWTPTPGTHAVVAPAAGVPLTIKGAMAKIVVGGIDFVAADAPSTTPDGQSGASSIGGVISGSTNVTLVDVTVTAGKGGNGGKAADGINGDPGVDWTMPPLPNGLILTTAGNAICSATAPAMAPVGASWSAPSACNSIGGGGGNAIYNLPGQDGQHGLPQTDVDPANTDNHGPAASMAGQNESGSDGRQGSVGVSGTNGPSAAASGTLSAADTYYTPANGKPGTDGNVGQGGGGGGASAGANGCTGAGGGVGGMGGCGATHGEGGKGGGASVALISWDSVLVLDTVQLTSKDGGAGSKGGKQGLGGLGGPGTDGGKGNVAPGIGAGGAGKAGGNGGNSGAGSGGTGGPSYGLVFHGTQPQEINSPEPQHGSGGALGKGGEAVAVPGAQPAADGAVGASASRYHVTP
jgi:hypothetical protein